MRQGEVGPEDMFLPIYNDVSYTLNIPLQFCTNRHAAELL